MHAYCIIHHRHAMLADLIDLRGEAVHAPILGGEGVGRRQARKSGRVEPHGPLIATRGVAPLILGLDDHGHLLVHIGARGHDAHEFACRAGDDLDLGRVGQQDELTRRERVDLHAPLEGLLAEGLGT